MYNQRMSDVPVSELIIKLQNYFLSRVSMYVQALQS